MKGWRSWKTEEVAIEAPQCGRQPVGSAILLSRSPQSHGGVAKSAVVKCQFSPRDRVPDRAGSVKAASTGTGPITFISQPGRYRGRARFWNCNPRQQFSQSTGCQRNRAIKLNNNNAAGINHQIRMLDRRVTEWLLSRAAPLPGRMGILDSPRHSPANQK